MGQILTRDEEPEVLLLGNDSFCSALVIELKQKQ